MESSSGSEADALRIALRYLAYRSRTEAEIRRYLRRRGHAPEVTDSVVEKLRTLSYLNDESFPRGWALARAQDRGFGPRRIEQELRNKGVDQPLIRIVLRETFRQVDERDRPKRLLTKHFNGDDLGEPKIARRAAAFLQRPGYSGKVVFDLLRYSMEDDC